MMNIIIKVSPKYELDKVTTKQTLFLLRWVFLFIQFHEHNNVDNYNNIQQTSQFVSIQDHRMAILCFF